MKVWKWVGLALGTIAVLAGTGVAALALRKPAQRPTTPQPFERSPARMARGKYLVEHLTHCLGCHSDLDLDRLGMPVKVGTAGQGGIPFDEGLGVPGLVCAQNITADAEFGLGKWTDDEVARAIREGVDNHGEGLFPMMPYSSYRAMSDEDVRSVVVYLRSLPPLHHAVPAKHVDFPINLLTKLVPQPEPGPVVAPTDAEDHLAYGKYLVTLAGCEECHSPHDGHGQKIVGREFSGGWVMRFGMPGQPSTRVVPPNITTDPEAYFGKATKEQWLARVHAYAGLEDALPKVAHGRNTLMGWVEYAGLTDTDLGAIYDFMKTVKPIKNKVDPFPDAEASR